MSHASVSKISLVTYPEQLEKTKLALIKNNCELSHQFDYTANYVIMDAIILCLALRAGGVEPEFDIHALPSQSRSLRALNAGQYFSASYTFWGDDFDKGYLLKTQNLVEKGEYSKGVYAIKNQSAKITINSPEDLKKYRTVSNSLWKKDWALLNCLNVETVDAKNHANMLRMLNAGRADFILASFHASEDFGYEMFGFDVAPVAKMKLSFNDSLNYFVSQNYPNSRKLFMALENGLTKLHQDGTIRKGYELAGIYNKRLESWDNYTCENGAFIKLKKKPK